MGEAFDYAEEFKSLDLHARRSVSRVHHGFAGPAARGLSAITHLCHLHGWGQRPDDAFGDCRRRAGTGNQASVLLEQLAGQRGP